MWLTGWPDAAPLAPAAPVVARLRAAAAELARLTGRLGTRVDIDVAVAVTGRAAILGLTRQGRVSAGGSCRLLPAADGWVAVSLARPSDHELVPAIVSDDAGDPWAALSAFAAVE